MIVPNANRRLASNAITMFRRCATRGRRNRSHSPRESEAMTADADYERTTYEVRLDICYAVRLYALHERFYARLDKGIKAIELIAGSGAFYAVTAGYTGTTKICALVVTTFALLSLVYDFGGRAREMRGAGRSFLQLLSEVDTPGATVPSIDKLIAQAGKDAPTTIDALAKPAYNQNLITHGRYSRVVPLNKREKFLQFVA